MITFTPTYKKKDTSEWPFLVSGPIFFSDTPKRKGKETRIPCKGRDTNSCAYFSFAFEALFENKKSGEGYSNKRYEYPLKAVCAFLFVSFRIQAAHSEG